MKTSEMLYFRYEYLARKYAAKIYSYNALSFEFSDLLQEFKIKIFTSIKSYARRYMRYKRGEAAKPVPLRFYLEAACSNKMRDFIKYISRENNKISIDELTYDWGVENISFVDPTRNKFIVNDIDLLEGLCGKERVVFSLFLKGCKPKIMRKVYCKHNKKISIYDVIESQKNFLITKYGNELMKTLTVYSSHKQVEDNE